MALCGFFPERVANLLQVLLCNAVRLAEAGRLSRYHKQAVVVTTGRGSGRSITSIFGSAVAAIVVTTGGGWSEHYITFKTGAGMTGDSEKTYGKPIINFLTSFGAFQKFSFVFVPPGITVCALSPVLLCKKRKHIINCLKSS